MSVTNELALLEVLKHQCGLAAVRAREWNMYAAQVFKDDIEDANYRHSDGSRKRFWVYRVERQVNRKHIYGCPDCEPSRRVLKQNPANVKKAMFRLDQWAGQVRGGDCHYVSQVTGFV